MIPLPLRDDNPTSQRALVTYAIVLINVLAWIFELYIGVDHATLLYGAIPAWVLRGKTEGWLNLPDIGRVHLLQGVPQPWTVLTSMFMHGGWAHIIGNLWFLWIFGDNVEDAMGRLRFVVFYLLCGALAAGTQILATADSTMPMVGASGAIAGVLGGYIVLYPRAKVRCLWILIIFITTIDVPAWLLLGVWFLSQFFMPRGTGVAWMAHVGGFVSGALLVRAFVSRGRYAYGRVRD